MAANLGLEYQAKEVAAAAMGDLRVFLGMAEKAGELVRVPGADPHLEMGALFELSHENLYPPILLFEDIKGYDSRFRVLSNVRTAKFVVGDLNLEAVKEFRRRPKERAELIPPRTVTSGPVLDNVDTGEAVNVLKFPAPLWHENDGGRYIGTECVVIVKDPDTGWVNLGTYRVMVHDDKTLGVFIEPGKHGDIIRRKYWQRGEPCPIAISVGQAPVLGLVAGTLIKPEVGEYEVAGGRIGRPIDVVTGKVTGLPIPADAEIVFEGFMPDMAVESMPEGPFGEWPGYYASGARAEAIAHVKAVYYRNDAIMLGMPPTGPRMPGRQVKINRVASLWDALEAAGVPEVTGVWKLPGGGTLFIDIISIKQLFPGHAKMAGLVSAGCGPGSYMNRLIIVVDHDIDITNPVEVMWALATRWDPKTQTDIIDGCWTGYIDPRVPPEKRDNGDLTTSRMIIYAVRPYHWKEAFPAVCAVPRDYAEEVRAKWKGKLPYLVKS